MYPWHRDVCTVQHLCENKSFPEISRDGRRQDRLYERVKDFWHHCDRLILAISRYFHFWPHSCSLAIRQAIEVFAIEQTAALSMTDHVSD